MEILEIEAFHTEFSWRRGEKEESRWQGQLGKKSGQFLLVHCSELPVLGISRPGITWHSSPCSFLSYRIFPLAKNFTFCFLGSLLLSETIFFWSQLFPLGFQAYHFLSLNSLCAEAQYVISFPIGGSDLYFLISWRIQDVQTSPKFITSPHQLQSASCSLLPESPKA